MPTQEETIATPYRYGSVMRRTGQRGDSFQVRIRRHDGSGKWKTATTHSYGEAEAILKQWNEEREAAARAIARSRT
jgi:hypothetical protein